MVQNLHQISKYDETKKRARNPQPEPQVELWYVGPDKDKHQALTNR